MTVKELIKVLETVKNQDAVVKVYNYALDGETTEMVDVAYVDDDFSVNDNVVYIEPIE